jgi:hypothetical protein
VASAFEFTPRLMQAEKAAFYIGVSPSKFRSLGLPRKKFDGNWVYERSDLDAYADSLPYETPQGESQCNEADNAWGRAN